MALFYVLLGAWILGHIRMSGRDRVFDDCLGKGETLPIKGVFILWVFLCHAMGYLSELGYAFASLSDRLYWGACAAPRQLTVVMFLFYSGYGVMECVRRRGKEYLATMPRKRILGTLVNFDVAVILFIALDIVLGRPLSVAGCSLALVAWESVGNSNWYIFTILACYLCAFVSCCVAKGSLGRVMTLVCCLALLAVGLSMVKETWWYDTIFAFGAGAVFACWRESFFRFLTRWYWPLLLVLVIGVVALQVIPASTLGFVANVKAVCFAVMVVMVTMKVRLDDRFFSWCGANLFLIYIYQRIPMLAMVTLGPDRVRSCPLLFVGASLIFTLGGIWLWRQVRQRKELRVL